VDPLRAWPIDEVDAILTANTRHFGVARISEIMRLDRLGLPVVSVMRRDPVGESVSVVSGKGDSVRAARVAALAEALERYCAEPRGRLAIVTARASELPGRVLAASQLILAVDERADHELEWCEGITLDGVTLWVPVNAVVFPYHPSERARALFAAHTHGLAVGSTRSEAIVHGLLECIERDAYSRAVALASVGRGDDVPVLAPGSVRDHAGVQIARIERAGLRWLARAVTCDTRVPTILATIAEGTWSHAGVAAHPDPRVALARALDEAAQSRLVDIQGAREDLLARDPEGADRWFLEAGSAETIDVMQVEALVPSGATDPIDGALTGLTQRLSAIGIEPIVVDLSLSEVALHVVRVIAPGLETWAYDPSRVGSRALGWLRPR
jgi:thioglycine synthase